MTEKRQRMISAMKYILLVIIVGYLVILMLYASGSKRTFSEVSKAVSSVLCRWMTRCSREIMD